MENTFIVAVLAGFGGMAGWGLADFFAKKTIDEIGDVTSLVWGHVFGTLTLFLVVLYKILVRGESMRMPVDIQTWLFLLLFGVIQAAIYFLLYKGFGKGQIAVLTPVFASFSGLAAAMSIVFLGEVVSGHLLFGLAILFAGILLISLDFHTLRSRRINFSHVPGMREVVFATVLASLWTLFWNKFMRGQDWLSYALFMYAFMTVAILAIAQFRGVKFFTVSTKPNLWKFLVLIGVCETGAYLAISLGYSKTSFTSVIALLSGAFSLPTIILARIFLKERISRVQTVGSIVIIIGIMLLSVR